jgi:hypothetical protein
MSGAALEPPQRCTHDCTLPLLPHCMQGHALGLTIPPSLLFQADEVIR